MNTDGIAKMIMKKKLKGKCPRGKQVQDEEILTTTNFGKVRMD
jgi:hypothetical protein